MENTGIYCQILKQKLLENCKKQIDFDGYYLKQIDNNFYENMTAKTHNEYDNGDGDELRAAHGSKYSKMNAVRSSSAMIYNILGNNNVEIKYNKFFPSGIYGKDFEFKWRTLDLVVKGKPVEANLDVHLYNNEVEIFIESKCLEWIENKDTERQPKKSYIKNNHYYINKESAPSFISVGKQLNCNRYDGVQMFRHALAIYNYLIDNHRIGKKIYLINVVWEPEIADIPNQYKQSYEKYLSEEHCEYDIFVNLMTPVTELISEETGCEFAIKYLTVKQFIQLINYSGGKKDYLKRYL